MDYRVIGAMLNSALYLVAVFVAGLVTAHVWSVRLAIAALGTTYISYLVQLRHRPGEITADGDICVGLSIILGVAAGLTLFL